MGIAERDYYSRPPASVRAAGPRLRPRGWSVTTWLIAINVAVFIFTRVLVLGPLTPTYMGENRLPRVTSAQWERGEIRAAQMHSSALGVTYTVWDTDGGLVLMTLRNRAWATESEAVAGTDALLAAIDAVI